MPFYVRKRAVVCIIELTVLSKYSFERADPFADNCQLSIINYFYLS
jgi:hypothetical protein